MGSRIVSLLLSFVLMTGIVNVPKAEMRQDRAEQNCVTEEKIKKQETSEEQRSEERRVGKECGS